MMNGMGSSLRIGLGLAPRKGGGVAPYPERTGTLLEPFEATTGWTHTGGHTKVLDAALAVQGEYALRFDPASTLGAVEYYKTFPALDVANLGRVAVYVHFDEDYDWQCNASVAFATRLLGAGSIHNLASRFATQQSVVGGQWLIGDVSLANALVGSAAVGDHQLRMRNALTGAKVGTTAFDAMYSNVSGKARLIFSFDDCRKEAITDAFPVMSALGLRGVLNVPVAKVGTTDCLTWEDIATLYAAGWSVQLNLTSDDLSILTYASPAAVIADFNAAKAELISRGFTRPVHGVCYSQGETSADGLRTEKAEITANGTTTVTMADVSGIAVGDRVIAWGASRTCRVDSVGSGQIITTEAVAAFTGPAAFVDDSGAFHGTKMQDAMIAAGIIFGRGVNEGDWFTQYGIAASQAIKSPSFSSTGRTRADWNSDAARQVTLGTNMDTYSHFVSDTPPGGSSLTWASFADFSGAMEDAAALIASGVAENATYEDIYNWDYSATPPV